MINRDVAIAGALALGCIGLVVGAFLLPSKKAKEQTSQTREIGAAPPQPLFGPSPVSYVLALPKGEKLVSIETTSNGQVVYLTRPLLDSEPTTYKYRAVWRPGQEAFEYSIIEER